MNAEHFPLDRGTSSDLGCKPTLPQGLCYSVTATAPEHLAHDPAALFPLAVAPHPKGAQSCAGSQGGIKAAAPVPGQLFSTHTAAVSTPL